MKYLMIVVVCAVALLVWQPMAAQGDVTPPALVSISVFPDHIWTNSSSQFVTITVGITDDLSGFASMGIRFVPEVGTTQMVDANFRDSDRISGDANDGIYATTIELPQYAAEGSWNIAWVYGSDNVGNSIDYYDDQGNLTLPGEIIESGRFYNGEGVPELHNAVFVPLIYK